MCFDRRDLKVSSSPPLFLCALIQARTTAPRCRRICCYGWAARLYIGRWLMRYFMRTISPPLSFAACGLEPGYLQPDRRISLVARSFGVLGRFQHYFFCGCPVCGRSRLCLYRKATRRASAAPCLSGWSQSWGRPRLCTSGHIPFARLAFAQAYTL